MSIANNGTQSKPAEKYDLELVRSAAASQWPSIHSSLGGIPLDSLAGDNREHPCPKCGGNTRFRMIDVQAGALFCSRCFNSRNGDGFSAVQWYLGCDFQTAIAKVAGYLNISPESDGSGRRKKKKADPNEHLKFREWSDIPAQIWCNAKQGITLDALKACGARLARYRDQYSVIAFPIRGEKGTAADPVGWVLVNQAATQKLPFYAPGKPVEWIKVKVVGGSEPGLVGQVDKLAAAKRIIKVEGISDMLTAISLGLSDDVAVVTNSAGAGQKPLEWMLDQLAGKEVAIIHDCDVPGERGAIGYTDVTGRQHPGWVQRLAGKAATVRNVKLPYPTTENHGKDLRDWIREGNRTAADLLALIDATPPSEAAPVGPAVIEADDDPHRLATVYLHSNHKHADGFTLRFWRNSWIEWRDNCWHEVKATELKARLTRGVKAEVDRINIDHQQNAHKSDDDKVKPAIKVTQAVVSNVIGALQGIVYQSDSIEYQSWIDPAGSKPPRRCNYISMSNGILDLDSLLANNPESLRPHSPAWFSPIYLPYPFAKTGRPEKFYKFLETNLENDPERIQLLQEWAGYLLTPDTSQQKFLFLEGEGANGKSVFMAVLKAMIGKQNISSVPLEVFGENFMLTQTLGKLANIVGECSELDSAAEGYLKSFVTGEQMLFNRKGLAPVEACPTARLILSANMRPRFSDRTSALWRRMHVVPWRVQIAEAEQIKRMDDPAWWLETGEMPAIFCWAVAGLHRLRANGRFTHSKAVQEAVDDYRIEANPARRFLLEFFQADKQKAVKTAVAYDAYCKWCEVSGYRPLSDGQFGREVSRAFPGSTKVRARGKASDGESAKRFYVYTGLNYRTETDADLEIGSEQGEF